MCGHQQVRSLNFGGNQSRKVFCCLVSLDSQLLNVSKEARKVNRFKCLWIKNQMSFSHHRTTIEWAESHNFPPFSQAKMEDTRFVDLKVKVGFPYLYCHQGDCEHLVIITDIRLKQVLLQQSISSHASRAH